MARRRSSKVEHLRQVPLFARLSDRQLSRVSRHVDEVAVEPGKVLARQGGTGRELLVIVEGTARVERDGRRIRRLGPGDYFGEMALIDGQPRSASVIAEEPMVLFTLHGRAFKPLLAEAPRLAESLLETLSLRLREAETTGLE